MKTRRFVLELSEEAFEKIRTIASNERRSIKDQAAVMLERAAEQRMPVGAERESQRASA